MKAFQRETSTVVMVPGVNCDTDQIIPGRFLKADRTQGYGQFLFHDIRRDGSGALLADFPLNREAAAGATILLVEDNFGCGSSREGAVYALVDHGIRALIGPSFGDIFRNNALKNGLIPVMLPQEICAALASYLADHSQATVTIDLVSQEIVLPGGLGTQPLLIDAFARDCIIKGVDEIGLTQGYLPQIEAFERRRAKAAPWVFR